MTKNKTLRHFIGKVWNGFFFTIIFAIDEVDKKFLPALSLERILEAFTYLYLFPK